MQPDKVIDFTKFKEAKRFLARICTNVYDKNGNIQDETRLQAHFELINMFLKHAPAGSNLILIGHAGRPKGQIKAELSLKKVTDYFSAKIGFPIEFISSMNDYKEIQQSGSEAKKVFLLENIRFNKGEEAKDPQILAEFANELANLGDVFIQDSFPDYKKAASTTEVAKLVPSYAGPAFATEISALKKLKQAPEKPFLALMGGAKLSDKLEIITELIRSVDKLLLGGGMAYTFLASQGIEIGKSLVEEDFIQKAKELIEQYPGKIILPKDHQVISEFNQESTKNILVTETASIPEDQIAVDIGPKTIREFGGLIKSAKTILWNGPMGVFEWEKTAVGTIELAKEISKNTGAYSVTGGGDSLAAIHKYNLDGFNHISTGGGGLLYFLSNDNFPTLDNLNFN